MLSLSHTGKAMETLEVSNETKRTMDAKGRQKNVSIMQPNPGEQEIDLRALLQALPAHADLQALPPRADMEVFVSRVEDDMEALVTRVEELHRRDLEAVRSDIQLLTDKLNNDEIWLSSLQNRIMYLEKAQTYHSSQANAIQKNWRKLKTAAAVRT